MTQYLLSTLIWLPIAGGFLTLLLGDGSRNLARWLSLGIAVATFAFSIPLYLGFDGSTAAFQFIERTAWITTFNADYSLGVDGIALPLILLTTFTTVLIVAAGWDVITERTAQYLGAFLILEGLMVGVFAAMDAMLFYFFWEAMLIPMFLIIGIWGGPRRVYATIKFFLYTFLGSVFMLIALIYMYLKTGDYSIAALQQLPLTATEQRLIFLAFLAAFAVKVPMFTITPDGSRELSWLVIALSLIAVVYIGFVALVQQDMKKLIAYSSIAHMGFVTLGAFLAYDIVANTGGVQGAALGIDGAMVQMISHGLVSGAMFLCVGVMYDRVHSRQISPYGGVINTMPKFGAFMVLFSMANAGLPATSGFVGEFMVILASFKANFWYAFAAGTTLILGAAYTLWLVKRVIFGPVGNDHVAALTDLNRREFAILAILAVAVLLLGLWPAPLLDVMRGSTHHLVEQMLSTKLPTP
ncbi:MAG: NADH-quinone oxidoreductase subunit M [Proteobacteria bacterium]|nr:NADH-quinone oxidoreductase subunit M [Pseudomonadota bacterium]